jgi:hypothetical protein
VLDGLSTVYVDDVLQAGTPQFDFLADSLSSNYDAKNKEYGCSRITGIDFYCDDDGISVNQTQYLQSLKPLPTEASYAEFRSARMKLAWLVHSRPYIAYSAASVANVNNRNGIIHRRALYVGSIRLLAD